MRANKEAGRQKCATMHSRQPRPGNSNCPRNSRASRRRQGRLSNKVMATGMDVAGMVAEVTTTCRAANAGLKATVAIVPHGAITVPKPEQGPKPKARVKTPEATETNKTCHNKVK